MTRPEYSGNRCLDFSGWIRKELPDSSTGFMVTNQDWVLWNYKTRRLMLLEEKTRFADVAPWFKRLIREVIHPALINYCGDHGIDYRGYHIVKFENTAPDNGKIFLDDIEITKEELKKILSLL